MDADLDTLCTVVYCTADDLLPEARGNARRKLTDAELVTLCVAQAIMGIPSDRRFLAVARKRLVHLFPLLPGQSGYHKRRRRLAGTIEWLLGVFAAQSPGYYDDLLLVDSTNAEVPGFLISERDIAPVLDRVTVPQFRVLVELDGRLGHEGQSRVADTRRDRGNAAAGWLTLRAGFPPPCGRVAVIDPGERQCWGELAAGSTSSTRTPPASLGWMKLTRLSLVPRLGVS